MLWMLKVYINLKKINWMKSWKEKKNLTAIE